MSETAGTAGTAPAGQGTHKSRCLACKEDVTWPVDFEGLIDTKTGVKRYAKKGKCPKGHNICTFVKKPQSPQ